LSFIRTSGSIPFERYKAKALASWGSVFFTESRMTLNWVGFTTTTFATCVLHGVVKQPRVAGHLDRHLVAGPQLAHETGQLLQPILAEVLPPILHPDTNRELIPMQIDSDVTSHVTPPRKERGKRGGVDVLCGGHQTPMRGRLFGPHGGASATGLTNLLDEVDASKNPFSL
jgi:hypothetical protein